jgi:carboxypeptidase D
MRLNISCHIAIVLAGLALAQFPPQPEGVAFKQLQGTPGVSISYKETFICETSARAWAGYVHMPASSLTDVGSYNISMFFWYFEAREDPHNAPTAIYLAGGPGDSSIDGAVQEAGPCTILEDANSTANNPYSYNTYVNMLYIDQPVSTGFSYSEKVNSTLDLLFLGLPIEQTGVTPFEAYGGAIPPENTTFLYGTLPDQTPQKTANGTVIAAKTLWHFCQAWFSGFPEYKTCNKNVNIFGNSYAGYYIPLTAEYTLKQNAKIAKGQMDGTTIPIDTVGWTNGCTDQLIQGDYYPDQAYNK